MGSNLSSQQNPAAVVPAAVVPPQPPQPQPQPRPPRPPQPRSPQQLIQLIRQKDQEIVIKEQEDPRNLDEKILQIQEIIRLLEDSNKETEDLLKLQLSPREKKFYKADLQVNTKKKQDIEKFVQTLEKLNLEILKIQQQLQQPQNLETKLNLRETLGIELKKIKKQIKIQSLNQNAQSLLQDLKNQKQQNQQSIQDLELNIKIKNEINQEQDVINQGQNVINQEYDELLKKLSEKNTYQFLPQLEIIKELDIKIQEQGQKIDQQLLKITQLGQLQLEQLEIEKLQKQREESLQLQKDLLKIQQSLIPTKKILNRQAKIKLRLQNIEQKEIEIEQKEIEIKQKEKEIEQIEQQKLPLKSGQNIDLISKKNYFYTLLQKQKEQIEQQIVQLNLLLLDPLLILQKIQIGKKIQNLNQNLALIDIELQKPVIKSSITVGVLDVNTIDIFIKNISEKLIFFTIDEIEPIKNNLIKDNLIKNSFENFKTNFVVKIIATFYVNINSNINFINDKDVDKDFSDFDLIIIDKFIFNKNRFINIIKKYFLFDLKQIKRDGDLIINDILDLCLVNYKNKSMYFITINSFSNKTELYELLQPLFRNYNRREKINKGKDVKYGIMFNKII